MRIIALQGKHDTGKTTTLKKLIETIWNEDCFEHEQIIGEFCSKGEMRCWVTCNSIKIGITTRGDGVVGLRGDFFEKRHNFRDKDLVVCAIRSHGKTEEFVCSHATDGLTVCKKAIAEPKLQKSTNQAQAKAILDNLLRIVKELEVGT